MNIESALTPATRLYTGPMSSTNPLADDELIVESLFIRERNVLLTRADLSSLYIEYYLHLADLGLKYDPQIDLTFKELLAAAVLHAVARPWNEKFAWTVNFQEPCANFFVTADNGTGTVTGTIFTENVRETSSNVMFAETIRGQEPKRRSVVDFSGSRVFPAVEHFYSQSEQRIARFFNIEDEEFWFLSAQPDCDESWLLGLKEKTVAELEKDEETSLLEKRAIRWHCGCEESRMYEVLLPAFRGDQEVLFQGEDSLRMQCPRCGKPYVITREGLEAYSQEKEA